MVYDWSNYRPSKNNELYEANKARDIVRENLTRMISQAIRNLRQGYAVRQVHDGYRNKYVWVYELSAENKAQREAYWSLVFAELPTYHDVIGGTPKLSWVFNLEEESKNDDSDLVLSAGTSQEHFCPPPRSKISRA